MLQSQSGNSRRLLLFLVISTITLFTLFGWYFFTPSSLQAQVDLVATGWRTLPALRSGVGDPALVVLDGQIHVVGGVEDFGASDLHEVFDPVAQHWTSLPALPRPLSDAAVAVVSDTLYLVGGYDILEEGALTNTYRFVTATQSWLALPPLLSPASGAGVAVIANEIYIFGGYDNVAESRLVQIYDPVHDRWRLGSPMPVGRSEFGMVSLNGLIYAIGGNIRTMTPQGEVSTRSRSQHVGRQMADSLSTLVSVYNPASDTWYTVEPLPAPRVSMAVTVLNEQIFVMGGTDRWITGDVQTSVYVYDPLSEQWVDAPALLTPRSGVRAVTLADTIYLLGGYDQANMPLANHEAYGLSANQLYLPVIQR